jgi:hypothetical protein
MTGSLGVEPMPLALELLAVPEAVKGQKVGRKAKKKGQESAPVTLPTEALEQTEQPEGVELEVELEHLPSILNKQGNKVSDTFVHIAE